MTGWLLTLSRQDERVFAAMVERRRMPLDTLMRTITRLGDAWFTITLAMVLASGLVPGVGRVGGSVVFTLVVSHLWVQMLKRSVSRARPSLPVGQCCLIEAPDRFSFPSGHAASSLSIVLPVLPLLAGPVAVLVLGLALLVGFSRCYLGVHYPGDVVMGWLLAVTAALMSRPALEWLGLLG